MGVLETLSSLPIASALKAVTGAGDGALTLGEITGRTLLHIRGGESETDARQSAQKIGDVMALADGLLARLRHDEFVLFAYDGRASLMRLEMMSASRHVTVTDITHGRCGLLLAGEGAAEVLRKVCGLDFGDKAFPNFYAAQTSLAKVRTLIIRADINDTPAYGLFVDRSLARYVWDVVYDAGQEFGISGVDVDTKIRGFW